MKFRTIFISFICTLVLTYCIFSFQTWHAERERKEISRIKESLSYKLGQFIKNRNTFPNEIEVDNGLFRLKYTINQKLQNYTENLLKRYRSDFASVVIIENSTGNILTVTGWERNKGRNISLSFTAGHPMASLAKIITSVDLIENTDITNEAIFAFLGRGSTLYTYQLENRAVSNKMRFSSLEKAFAFSNNVVFGKAAIENTNAVRLYNMANKFGFNRKLMNDVDLMASHFDIPEGQYNLAELASGFNRETLLSPIHAAVLASIVSNEGIMMIPKILMEASMKNDYLKKYSFSEKPKRIFAQDTALALKRMMRKVLFQGTARHTFKRMNKKLKNILDLGGKTGSITGGSPFGKRDWFVMYASLKDQKDKSVSIAVMNVNLKKWFVKATDLALMITEHYYKNDLKVYLDKKKLSF